MSRYFSWQHAIIKSQLDATTRHGRVIAYLVKYGVRNVLHIGTTDAYKMFTRLHPPVLLTDDLKNHTHSCLQGAACG
ncbi:hypothetical protein [Mesorhizobium sp. M0195]|uniref:hypothetical protein n=1 Tax=Mesorhizobium sp. M0195 TaxID=2956910 RepID=UPI003338A52D